MTPTSSPARLRRLALAVLAVLAALGVSACGEKVDRLTPEAGTAQRVTLELDSPPNAVQAGIYEAKADGGFTAADLDVQIITPKAGVNPLTQAENGEVNVAVTSEPELMLQRDVKAIAQQPLAELISVGSRHITSFADLRGTTVGVSTAPGQRQMFGAALQAAGVSPGSVRQVALSPAQLVPAMTSKRVAATFGGTAAGAGATLRRDHDKPNLVPITRSGVPNYDELVFASTEIYYENNVSTLRRLVQAIGRGYAAVRANPAAGVRALRAVDPSASATELSAAITQTLPALFPGRGEPWGWQFETQWNRFGKWMVKHHVLHHPSWYKASVNQLQAGVGP
jgi:putative hydroxymethylpyrimidine transport system substrate-binding protein